MIKRVFYGKVIHQSVNKLVDINSTQFFILSVLLFLTLALGIYPKFVSNLSNVSVEQFIQYMSVSKLPII